MSAILVERDGPVAVLTLHRPAVRNAVDGELALALGTALRELDADGTVRACVLTGAGPAFCAGMDLREFADGGPGAAPGCGGHAPVARPAAPEGRR